MLESAVAVAIVGREFSVLAIKTWLTHTDTRNISVSVCWPKVSAKSCGCFAQLVAVSAMAADSSLGQVWERCERDHHLFHLSLSLSRSVCLSMYAWVLAKWQILTMCVGQSLLAIAFEGYFPHSLHHPPLWRPEVGNRIRTRTVVGRLTGHGKNSVNHMSFGVLGARCAPGCVRVCVCRAITWFDDQQEQP